MEQKSTDTSVHSDFLTGLKKIRSDKRALMCMEWFRSQSILSKKMHWYKKMSNDSKKVQASLHRHIFTHFRCSWHRQYVCRGDVHHPTMFPHLQDKEHYPFCPQQRLWHTPSISHMTLDREKRAKKRKFVSLKIENYFCILTWVRATPNPQEAFQRLA